MCLTPINLKKTTLVQTINDDYHYQQVPCGRCLECRRLRINSWYVRLIAQKSVSISAGFVTLTIDPDAMDYSDNGLFTLDYHRYQSFIKRLRKVDQDPEHPIKYFAVGEYGSKTYRPHFHAIIFNVNNWQNVANCWGHGHVHKGDVTDASIFYTLKYALKSVGRPRGRDPDDDRAPEKALMSKGLGLSFLTPEMIKHYKDDVSRPVTMLGNKKIGLPRYYRDKIFTDTEKKIRNKLLMPFNDEKYEKTTSPLFPQRVEKMYRDVQEKLKQTD